MALQIVFIYNLLYQNMECGLIVISLSAVCVIIGINILRIERSSRLVMPKGKANNHDGKGNEKPP